MASETCYNEGIDDDNDVSDNDVYDNDDDNNDNDEDYAEDENALIRKPWQLYGHFRIKSLISIFVEKIQLICIFLEKT